MIKARRIMTRKTKGIYSIYICLIKIKKYDNRKQKRICLLNYDLDCIYVQK